LSLVCVWKHFRVSLYGFFFAAANALAEKVLAAQQAAFNLEAAEQAELEREREVLESMVQAQLKDEDEVMKNGSK